jgi:hypothetical protein
MTTDEKDEIGMTDPHEGTKPSATAETLPNEEIEPKPLGPPIKINPTKDDDRKKS